VLYTYVLLCGRDHRFYTGCTRDLRLRFQQQQSGRVRWTASRQPVRLIYYEACLSAKEFWLGGLDSNQDIQIQRLNGQH
jgi:putative endonuclease